jgi:hypothetical protein
MAVHNVSRRMKQLGIRVALDARKAQVMSVAVGRPIAAATDRPLEPARYAISAAPESLFRAPHAANP